MADQHRAADAGDSAAAQAHPRPHHVSTAAAAEGGSAGAGRGAAHATHRGSSSSSSSSSSSGGGGRRRSSFWTWCLVTGVIAGIVVAGLVQTVVTSSVWEVATTVYASRTLAKKVWGWTFGSGDDQHHKSKDDKFSAVGWVVQVQPQLAKLLDKDAQVEQLVDGLGWAEGPVWAPKYKGFKGPVVLYSDTVNNVIWGWDVKKEKAEQVLKPAGLADESNNLEEPGSNGLAIEPHSGKLVVCDHGNRRIYRLEKGGKQEVLADKFEGKRLNSPNDLVFADNGDFYFTDPSYGLKEKGDSTNPEDMPTRELSENAVYRVAAKDQSIHRVAVLERPNGIAFTPDQKYLIVSSSSSSKPLWRRYKVKSDGSLDDGEEFGDVDAGREKIKSLMDSSATIEGNPDGLTIHKSGMVLASGPGGIWVMDSGGELLGLIYTGKKTSNVEIGEDGYLYITADSTLLRVPTNQVKK